MPQYEDITVSHEFIHLCEAQLNLLCHNFFAQESAIYLTDNHEQEPKLIPIVVYPNSSSPSPHNLLPSITDKSLAKTVNDVFDDNLDSPILSEDSNDTSNSEEPNQLVLPLIYQDIFFGILATTKTNLAWQTNEVCRIKEIAQTIAISRFMEQKQQLLQTQYTQLRHIQDLEHSNLDDFLHQLKNPLTAVRTFAKLLLKQILPEEASYNTSKNIIRESDRLKELINDFNQQWQTEQTEQIITLHPHESASFFLSEQIENLSPVDVIEVVTPIIEAIKLIGLEKNIQVESTIASTLPLVMSNAKALQEIINNLLENAVKYTPENGHILLEIELNNANSLEIKISDTGYGIPLEDQEYIFERNYRGVQSEGIIEGTGLGLAIVKELCDKTNIQISLISPYKWKENQNFQGTQFKLIFPAQNIIKKQ